jgi:hypothetical protein
MNSDLNDGGQQNMDLYEITAVIHDSIGWALTKDIDRLFSIVTQDDDLFIYHPDSGSTIRGFKAFRELGERVWLKDSFKATGYAIHDLSIHLSESGTVAWYACRLDDHAEWNGKPGGWDDVRWTGVIEKRAGRWQIVQMHFSFPRD